MEIAAMDQRAIGPVELQEYLFAATQGKKAFGGSNAQSKALTDDIREILRLHRFVVFNWLLISGVSIPAELLADETHPGIGKQLPDQPTRLDA